MPVLPSINRDKHDVLASWQRLSTTGLVSFNPLRFSAAKLQTRKIPGFVRTYSEAEISSMNYAGIYGEYIGEKHFGIWSCIDINLFKVASLASRLMIAFPDTGLLYPVEAQIK